ncbi:hypothetical protein ACUXCC_001494 [Cytobacillus horneckiae]|uniref:Cytochrome-c oxidase n=1 Tax=Cytobacillus horneckiae TaxID=549687 RepID=A0A2N0ZLB4_9BACI|nr:hypothetical protein [Cytobacillus horneckiae]MBN6885741.1 hypothetical protein [Cytobacillus horneckiae]MCM3177288.1 hypothetical protein [Cytobacillus horneckiae]MEC1156150.1 hypothetical protein [Cytobacillus horneckiae]MED2937509.1 hypothetical protein [Cytobacillus horneckiae]PKG30310.1 hypothetical protein CWS20_04780 [Cytobacillus horneckiae]
MNKYSKILLRLSAVFALIGAYLGSHMAGAGGYAFRPVHAHSLVVGWLSLFAWAVYYQIFTPKLGLLAKLHVCTAIIGSVGLTGGMAMFIFKPEILPEPVHTVVYIVGGSILLLSFLFFLILTFTNSAEQNVNNGISN